MTSSNERSTPRLDWPDEAYGDEREVFYGALMQLLGPAKWVSVVPTPAPLGAVRRGIEKDCHDILEPLELAYDGVAWLCPWSSMMDVLPGLFHARRPELAFLAFETRPDALAITAALQSVDASPAVRLLWFDDGELVEQRGANG